MQQDNQTSSLRPKLPCRWKTEAKRAYTYYTYPQIGDEAAYTSAPEDVSVTSDGHWNRTGVSAGEYASVPRMEEAEDTTAEEPPTQEPPRDAAADVEHQPPQRDESDSHALGDTAGTDSRHRMTVRERRAARKRKGSRKHLSEEELIRRQKRKQEERERADSRLLPDSGFSRRYHKPPFHSYGWGHRSPLKGGIMWGRYMASYSINPLLHPANTKTEEAMDQVDFVHNEALLHHEQNTLHRSQEGKQEETEEMLLDAARMTLEEEREEWRTMHETERARSRHHHVSIKALQKPPPSRKGSTRGSTKGSFRVASQQPKKTTKKVRQRKTRKEAKKTQSVAKTMNAPSETEDKKALEQTNPPAVPLSSQTLGARFFRGNSDQVRASLTWIHPEEKGRSPGDKEEEDGAPAPPSATASSAAAPPPKKSAPPPVPPPQATSKRSFDLTRFTSPRKTQSSQTHIQTPTQTQLRGSAEVVVLPFIPGNGLERDPHLFKRLPPHWCQAIPAAGTRSAPSDHVKDALHMFD